MLAARPSAGLVEPVTLEAFKAKTSRNPPSIFSHNFMQRAAANVHAQYGAAKGVLGRICDALRAGKTNKYSLRRRWVQDPSNL